MGDSAYIFGVLWTLPEMAVIEVNIWIECIVRTDHGGRINIRNDSEEFGDAHWNLTTIEDEKLTTTDKVEYYLHLLAFRN